MTNTPTPSLIHTIDLGEGLPLVCEDAASGQVLRFATRQGRPIITYSFLAHGQTQEVVLHDAEAADLNAWRHNGRRTSYWDWPGWAAVRQRADAPTG